MIIKNGLVIDPESGLEAVTDLEIENGRIIKIGTSHIDYENTQVLDATGCVIAPGLVDIHVHFRDPGFTYKEDIETGAKAAAKGGFTTVVLMANTKPVVDNRETLDYILTKAREQDIHIETCGTITLGLKSEELSPMEILKQEGAVGFTDDGIPMLDEKLVIKAMEMAKKLDVPLSFHEEDPAFITNNGIHAGRAAAHYKLVGSPREAEISMVERDIRLAMEVGATTHIQHISTKEAVALIREAQKSAPNIHCEATPHHFSLTEEAVITYGSMAKMNPPLREEEDRQAIIEGLKDNTIDIIATDHAPHSMEEKNREINQAPSGIVGLETALSLGITNLVKPGYLTLRELLGKMTFQPANLYHLPAGRIKEGALADLVIFQPEETWKVDKFVSKSQNSPFLGQTLYGKVCYTICQGKVVYNYRETT